MGLLVPRLALPEQARLAVVLGEQLGLAAHFTAFDVFGIRVETARAGLEGAAAGQRIGLVVDAAAVDGLAVEAVALVVVHLRHRRIDRDLVEVRPAQARELGVDVGVDAPLQQRVVGEVDPRDHVGRAEGHLLGLGEEVVRIAVQDQAPDRAHRHQFLRNQLGGVEHVEDLEGGRLLLGKYLQAELPFREVAGLDRLPQVAPVEIRVGAGQLDGLVPDQGMGALERRPVELAEARLAPGIDQAEGVHAEALHHAEAAGNGAVRLHPHLHVEGLGRQAGEVVEGVVGAGGLRHLVVGLGLDRMDHVRELHRVLDEEHRDVVADQVPDAFVGIELGGEAAHVAHSVAGSARTGHGGEAHEHGRFLAGLGEGRGAGDLREVVVALEEAVGARTARMHHALGNAFVVEMGHLLAEDEVFHRGRPAQPDLQRVLVVAHLHALVGGQRAAAVVDPHPVQRAVQRVLADLGRAVADLARGDVFGRGAGGGQRGRGFAARALVRRDRILAVFERLGRVERHLGGQGHVRHDFLQQALALGCLRAQAGGRLGVGRAGNGAEDGSGAVERAILLACGHASPLEMVGQEARAGCEVFCGKSY